MKGRAESENDFLKTKVNGDYIKTFPPQKESLPFLQEDAASNNGSENDITIVHELIPFFGSTWGTKHNMDFQ